MIVHRLSSLARRVLPEQVFSALRTAGNVVLTPALFSFYTGHARSALRGLAVDRHGQPLPWYTYPAINFLQAKHLRDRDVLEFGAGHSTLWWGGRARSVAAFESDPGWRAFLSSRVPPNVELRLVGDFQELEAQLAGRRFDVIIIDGLDTLQLGRTGCAERALGWLKEGGAILLDNSDGSWSPDGRFRIMDLFRQRGFGRVDFYGFCPGNVATSCTSLLFDQRAPCFLLSGEEDPIKAYPLAQHE